MDTKIKRTSRKSSSKLDVVYSSINDIKDENLDYDKNSIQKEKPTPKESNVIDHKPEDCATCREYLREWILENQQKENTMLNEISKIFDDKLKPILESNKEDENLRNQNIPIKICFNGKKKTIYLIPLIILIGFLIVIGFGLFKFINFIF